jgi:hypothetical protein
MKRETVANYTNHYLGAYLEIHVQGQDIPWTVAECGKCKNGRHKAYYNYCPFCGLKLEKKVITKVKYQGRLSSVLEEEYGTDFDFGEHYFDITPEGIRGKGVF